MTRKTVIGLLAFTLLAGWGAWKLAFRSSAAVVGRPWLAELAGGRFLPQGLRIDFQERYWEEQDSAASASPLGLPRLAVVEQGWGGPEDWGTWALGERTKLRFFMRFPQPYEFFIECMAAVQGGPQTVTVSFDGEELGVLTVATAWEKHRLPIPETLLSPGSHTVELAYGYHLDGIPGHDDRPLALAIKRVGLLEPEQEWPVELPGAGVALSEEQEALVFTASGSYLVALELPVSAAAFDFDLRAAVGSGSAAREMALKIAAITWDGREENLLTVVPETANGRSAHHSLALRRYRGRRIFLVVDVKLPPGSRFEIRQPRLVAGAPPARPLTSPGPRSEPARSELPHIVIIILDAARADHFGVYGYERDTTPHIDRFAAEALVFRNVTAECSYTLCSMPNLLTGLSFVQHGLVAKRLRLRERVRTLAETLAEAGYLTLGYTGNPNNSRGTGTAQGFDEFSEIWETHPGEITRRLRRRLAAGIGERPLFLELHYVPPHEPYAPDREFDLFGDSDYSGQVTSDREFARAVYTREIELDPTDLAELVSLYDGNLRMADAAVGQVFAALRDAGLWDDALVVVSSDHGEAFMEHGRVGHNTTIYEEMMRVPLVVKLPAGRSAEGIDTERLRSLGDLVPTILGLAGVEPPEEVRFPDLLAPASPTEPERAIFLRSSQPERTIFGVRTPRWKAIARRGEAGELYDLVADPRESTNRIAERPLLHAGLLLLLDQAMAAPSPLRAGVREEELSQDDQRMLRALGYVN